MMFSRFKQALLIAIYLYLPLKTGGRRARARRVGISPQELRMIPSRIASLSEYALAYFTNAIQPSLFKGGKRWSGALLFTFLVIATPALAAPVKVLMLGTSLTQGYGLPPGTEIPALLQAELKAAGVEAKVINAGVSGDTSADALSRLDWSLADQPEAATVEVGSNDALRGIPPTQTEKNLSAILRKLKAQHIPTLLLGMKAPRNLGPEYARAFDAMYPTLAKQYGVVLYPFLLQGVALNPKLNQADGMHPNPAGAKIIADRLLPIVRKLIAQAQEPRGGGR